MPTIKENATTAANLIKSTAEAAATALNIQYIQRDITEIKQVQKENATKMEQALKDLQSRDDSYVLKEDFNFWRNILVSGLLLSIAIGVILNLLK